MLKQFSTFAVAGTTSQPKLRRRRRLLRRLLRLRLVVRHASRLAPRERAARDYRDETRLHALPRSPQARTQVVFGSGDPNADLMFVGEAPGFHEDQQGVPFVGQAGKLLDKLLAGIGLARADVYVANVLKCRPPGNRDPQPDEIEACEAHLFRQIELIQPTARRDARQLRDEAPLREADRDHARARASSRSRSAATPSCSTRSTTRPPRSTRPRC